MKIKGVFAAHCALCIEGRNNEIIIDPGLTRLSNCKFRIYGNNCKIHIGADSNLTNTTFYIQDDFGEITLGKHVTITGNTELAVIEGKRISIGEDCLFSSEINLRVGDSHSIISKETGCRINPSKDIVIGNHVWIGNAAKILKGSCIGHNSIVGTGSVVCGKVFPPHCILGGVPAKVIKTDIDWCPERV